MIASNEGFTLIELMVVIAIIGILAAAAVPQVTGYICRAQGSAAESALATVQRAYTQCLLDHDQSTCSELDPDPYNTYLSSDVINSAEINTVSGGSLNSVTYSGVGCAYNSGSGCGPSNTIRWDSSSGNIDNVDC
jgi:type IV pilus assembly protein PilA